jgi:hypothetical protein
MPFYRTREDMAHAIEDFKGSEKHLRRCCLAAREFGFRSTSRIAKKAAAKWWEKKKGND